MNENHVMRHDIIMYYLSCNRSKKKNEEFNAKKLHSRRCFVGRYSIIYYVYTFIIRDY